MTNASLLATAGEPCGRHCYRLADPTSVDLVRLSRVVQLVELVPISHAGNLSLE